MKTIKEEFEIYLAMVYGAPISGVQRKELHAAWFASALIMRQWMDVIDELPENQGVEALRKLRLEIEVTCKAISTVNPRNPNPIQN